jgi:hypothetical protein
VRPVDDEVYWVNVVEAVDGRKLPEGEGIRVGASLFFGTAQSVAVNELSPGYFAILEHGCCSGASLAPTTTRRGPRWP